VDLANSARSLPATSPNWVIALSYCGDLAAAKRAVKRRPARSSDDFSYEETALAQSYWRADKSRTKSVSQLAGGEPDILPAYSYEEVKRRRPPGHYLEFGDERTYPSVFRIAHGRQIRASLNIGLAAWRRGRYRRVSDDWRIVPVLRYRKERATPAPHGRVSNASVSRTRESDHLVSILWVQPRRRTTTENRPAGRGNPVDALPGKRPQSVVWHRLF